jgi:hypothetical protein
MKESSRITEKEMTTQARKMAIRGSQTSGKPVSDLALEAGVGRSTSSSKGKRRDKPPVLGL